MFSAIEKCYRRSVSVRNTTVGAQNKRGELDLIFAPSSVSSGSPSLDSGADGVRGGSSSSSQEFTEEGAGVRDTCSSRSSSDEIQISSTALSSSGVSDNGLSPSSA